MVRTGQLIYIYKKKLSGIANLHNELNRDLTDNKSKYGQDQGYGIWTDINNYKEKVKSYYGLVNQSKLGKGNHYQFMEKIWLGRDNIQLGLGLRPDF